MKGVKIKIIKECKAAVIKNMGPYDEVGPIFAELYKWLSKKGVESPEPPFGIYYDNPDEVTPEKCRYEICVPIEAEVKGDKRVEIKEFPIVEVATIIHKGTYCKIGETWKAIYQWFGKEGYTCTGPGREVYLNCPDNTDEENLLTEIQIPVKKKK